MPGLDLNPFFRQLDAGEKQGVGAAQRRVLAGVAGLAQTDPRAAGINLLAAGLTPQANTLLSVSRGDQSNALARDRFGFAQRSANRQFDRAIARDAVSDERFNKTFGAQRSDAAFNQNMAQKRYTAGQEERKLKQQQLVENRRAQVTTNEFNRRVKLEELRLKQQNAQRTSNKPPTADAAKAMNFAARMRASNKILSKPDVSDAGMSQGQSILESIPFFSNSIISPQRQMFNQAQRDFINSILRRESGAVISEAEFDNAREQYLPQPGDGPDVLRQKADNRRRAIAGIEMAAGRAQSPAGAAQPRLKYNPQTGALE